MKLDILLDIEALLDTRVGRLKSLGSNMVDEILFKFGEYCNRDHDNLWLLFPEITEEMYKGVIVDVDILKLSPRTNIFNVIDDTLRSTSGSLKDDVELTIHLCTKHFKLSDASIQAFITLISARYEHIYTVRHLDKEIKDLTPKWLEEFIDIAILYDFNQWTDTHHESLMVDKVSSTIFYIPTIFRDKVAAERGFYSSFKASKLDGDPLEMISDYIWESYQINLYFISNKFFSPISMS